MIYLYGGWDGNKDLADMWSYHVPSAEWTCISKNTDEDVRSFKNTSFSSGIVLFYYAVKQWFNEHVDVTDYGKQSLSLRFRSFVRNVVYL